MTAPEDSTSLPALACELQAIRRRWDDSPAGGYPEDEAAVISDQQREAERRINLAEPADLGDVSIKLRTILDVIGDGFELAEDEVASLNLCLAFVERAAC